MVNLMGKRFGEYQIIEEIGRGGMAIVYKAYQPSRRRYVALKVLPAYFQHDVQFLKRFHREAQAAKALDHPNIVKVYESGEVEGLNYIAMEYVDGGSVAGELRRRGKPFDLTTAVNIIAQIGAALEYAHSRGIVHRDIKPSNILLTKDGRALLSDFGIAKAVGTSTITEPGALVGTPQYMSPEQAKGRKDIDHRTDIYSLGVVLYQMLTGEVPFDGETPHVILRAVIDDPPPRPSSVNSAIPLGVEWVILRALEKDRGRRFQRVGEMVAALQAVTYAYQIEEAEREARVRKEAEALGRETDRAGSRHASEAGRWHARTQACPMASPCSQPCRCDFVTGDDVCGDTSLRRPAHAHAVAPYPH